MLEAIRLQFMALKFAFSIATSALIAWILAEFSDENFWIFFVTLVIGLPLIKWLEHIKNIPSHLAASFLLGKSLIRETKRRLKRLPLKTADEWDEFQSFYDDDRAITEFAATDPKGFAVSNRYSLQTMKDYGMILESVTLGVIISQAIDQTFWESSDASE